MRQLKHHEQRLLKKVDFIQWRSDENIREIKVIRRYNLTNREDYHKYNKIVGMIKKLSTKLSLLKPDDAVRQKITDSLMQKLFSMGLVPSANALSSAAQVSVSSICRRRLPVMMVFLKMAQSVTEATRMIEQGHVRVGVDVVTDPAYVVNRTLGDYVRWVDGSKYDIIVKRYNDRLDDFDLLG